MLRICRYVPTLEYMLVDDETPMILCKTSDKKECERIKFMLEESRKDRVMKHDIKNLKEKFSDFRLRLKYGEFDNILLPISFSIVIISMIILVRGV